MSEVIHQALAGAARSALRAPSVLNTQPWKWRLEGEALELHADRSRQLTSIDPHGKLLLLSCGIALHHARLALAFSGHTPHVQRVVNSFADDLVARITVEGPHRPTAQDRALQRATWTRRTDRRPFSDRPVSRDIVQLLQDAAASEGALAHRVRLDQMPMLAIAADQASSREMADPEYRIELMRWLNRPEWSGDGVPATTAVAQVPRRVPVRPLVLDPNEGTAIDPGGDLGAAYLIVYGNDDRPIDWLVAGEASSAVLLAATSLGLGIAPMSDVIEVAHSRELLAGLLPGAAHPYLALRCGWQDSTGQVDQSPRRPAGETIVGLSDG